jgi:DNA-binding NarL/FixJ family response regulator
LHSDDVRDLLRLVEECRQLVDAGGSPSLRLRRGVARIARGDHETEEHLLEMLRATCPSLFAGEEAQADTLSPREQEALGVLLTGAPEKQVAVRLGVSRHTAHEYVKALYRKLGVRSRAQLMARRRWP